MSEPLQVKVPFENVNDPTAKIVEWKFSSGSKVKAGDEVVELETTKTTFPVAAPAEGFLEYFLPLGEEVPVGGDLFRIHGDEASAKAPRTAIPAKSLPVAVPATGAPMISKRAQELMAANGLDAASFIGMAVVKEADVREKLVGMSKSPARAPLPDVPASQAAPKKLDEPGKIMPLERSKLVENRELSQVDREVLKSTVYYFCPAGGLQEACARQNPPVQRLVVVLFELVRLLKKYSSLNSYLADGGVFVYQHIHLGFAVDMGHGLKVLVVREAEDLNFAQFAEKVDDLLVKYATGGLAVKEITGSTFTVTDLSQTGLFTFEPLINSRQAAILGIGAEQRGVSGTGFGFMLSCAFDHRLTTGRVVAEFLGEFSIRLVGHAESMKSFQPVEPVCCSRCLQTSVELKKVQAFLLPSVEPPGYLCSHCLFGH